MFLNTFAQWGRWAVPISTDSWLVFAIVLIGLIIFVWVIVRLITRVTDDTDPAETDRQMLSTISELHRKGDLSQEEFRSIKGRLVERLRNPGPVSVDANDPAESAMLKEAPAEFESPRLESETKSGEDTTIAT